MQDNYFIERKIKVNKKINELLCELPHFIAEFIVGIENKTTELTRNNYLLDLRIFFDYLQRTKFSNKKLKEITLQDIDSLTSTDIEMFLNYTNAFKYYGKYLTNGERGKARKLSAIRAFFRYFFNKDKLTKNITTKISMPKLHDKNIIRLEIDEVSNLLNTTESPTQFTQMQKSFHEHTRLRDVAILTTLLGTGLRVSECVGLNFTDIDFNINAFKIVRKGGNQVILYFPDEVEIALKNYINERNLKVETSVETIDALFLSMQKKRITVRAVEILVKKYSKLISPLKKITPHKLRSTYGTSLYRETHDIYVVAEVLGHKDINTTKKHYAAISEDIKRNASTKVTLRDKN